MIYVGNNRYISDVVSLFSHIDLAIECNFR
jgi:hypothetical protein